MMKKTILALKEIKQTKKKKKKKNEMKHSYETFFFKLK